jgi:hypothetical protein
MKQASKSKQNDPLKGLVNALKAAKVAQLAEKVAEAGQ